MNRLITALLATAAAAALFVPTAAAHPTATPVTGTGGQTCYVYWNFDDPTNVELYRESNGDASGGVPTAKDYVDQAPNSLLNDADGHSGLQRGDGGDQQYDAANAAGWAADCGLTP